jgi:type II secretory pathway component HofQ
MKILRLLILFLFIAAFVAAAQDAAVPGASITPVEGDTAQSAVPAAAESVKPDEPDTGEALGLMVMDIKPSNKNSGLYSIELRNTPLLDLFRLMARDYNLNIVVDDKVTGTITASLSDIGLEEALQTIVDMKNLKIEKKGRVIIIRPNLISKIFVLHHLRLRSIVSVDTTSSTTSSVQAAGAGSAPAAPAAGQPQAAPSASAENKEATETTSSSTTQKIIFQKLLSPDGYVIPDVQGNSFMAVDYPENIDKIAEFIKMADMEKEKRVIKLQYVSANDLMGGQGAR